MIRSGVVISDKSHGVGNAQVVVQETGEERVRLVSAKVVLLVSWVVLDKPEKIVVAQVDTSTEDLREDLVEFVQARMSWGSKCPNFKTSMNIVLKLTSWRKEWFGLGRLKPLEVYVSSAGSR